MSGGHFDYDQYRLNDIASQIKRDVFFAKGKYSDDTIAEFRKAIKMLEETAVYVERIDYLISGDDGEDNFHKRLKEDLEKVSKHKETPCMLAKCEYCENFVKNDKEGNHYFSHEKCRFVCDNSAYGGYSIEEARERQKKFEEDAHECWDFEPTEEVKEKYLYGEDF